MPQESARPISRAAAMAAERERIVRGFSEAFLNHAALKDHELEGYKADEGEHYLRIVPWSDTEYYGLNLYIHFQIGVAGDSVLCPRMMEKKTCPICRACNTEKQRRGADWKDPVVQKLNVGKNPRTLFFVIDMLNHATTSEGLKYYIAPHKVNEGLQGLCRRKRTGDWWEPFGEKDGNGDLVVGNVFTFTRKGKTKNNTEYLEFALEEEKEALDPALYRDRLCDPHELVIIPTEAEINEIFDLESVVAQAVAEREEEDAGARTRRGSARDSQNRETRQPVSRPSREDQGHEARPERPERRTDEPGPAAEPRSRAARDTEPEPERTRPARTREEEPAPTRERERSTSSKPQEEVRKRLDEVRNRQRRQPEPEPEGDDQPAEE